MINKYTLVAPLLLLGCASQDDLMRNKADLIFRSAKEAKTVATCIAEHWKTYAQPSGETVPVMMREMLGTYTLTVSCNGGKSCKVAEVTPALDNQSKTTMYTIAIGEGSYISAVDYCQ